MVEIHGGYGGYFWRKLKKRTVEFIGFNNDYFFAIHQKVCMIILNNTP